MQMEILETILLYLPVIGLLALVQLALMIFAIVHAVTHQNFRIGNLTIWIIVIIVINLLGPILYFIIGRGEAEEESDEHT
ncbi:MAG: PLDc N-terminal domain-containing protein [Lachnospiraceae bacterium]|nr:PLDc N-terminal domain-containing protein [Lachnospiraceae bacterium]